MTWTDEKIELLKTLRAKGVGSADIAYQVSLLPPYNAVTRNAVIGKCARLGLESCNRNGARQYHVKRGKKGSRRPSRSPIQFRKSKWATFTANLTAEPMPDYAENDIARISFDDLDTSVFIDVDGHEFPPPHCKWPVGDVATAGQTKPLFCGVKRVPGQPYCLAHCHRAFSPPALRKLNIPVPVEREKETV